MLIMIEIGFHDKDGREIVDLAPILPLKVVFYRVNSPIVLGLLAQICTFLQNYKDGLYHYFQQKKAKHPYPLYK
jgi:hypothetical protein